MALGIIKNQKEEEVVSSHEARRSAVLGELFYKRIFIERS